MSKESLDYQKLCSNYYSSWEEGCCMESCEFYNHNECPVVYVNGLLEERDKTIADLEAKLAESEKNVQVEEMLKNYGKEEIKKLHKRINEIVERDKNIVENLNQQLAEKDSTIKTLIEDSKASKELLKEQLAEKDTKLHEYIRCALEDYNDNQKEIIELKQQLAEKDEEAQEIYEMYNQERKKNWLNNRKHQDKISFALEQLEKVKEILIQNADEIGEEYKEDYFMISLGNVKNIIDNQIKQLKEMK